LSPAAKKQRGSGSVGLNPAPEAKNTPNIIALQKDSQANCQNDRPVKFPG
jgi:hypothetical protein